MKKTNRIILPLLAFIIGISVAAASRIAARTPSDAPASRININYALTNLPATISSENLIPFHYEKKNGFSGALTLTGWPIVIDPPACVPTEKAPCPEKPRPSYVFFAFIKTTNDLIHNFITTYQKTPFVADNAIGLGCYDKETNQFFSENPGDRGTFINSLTGDNLKRFLASDGKHRVKLTLTKPVFTGTEKPHLCYSYFRDFKITPLSASPATTSTVPVASSTPVKP